MQHKFRVRVDAGQESLSAIDSLSVSGAIAWSLGSTAISAGPEQAAAHCDARSAGGDRPRGHEEATALELIREKCGQLYSSRAVIVGARDARPEAMDDGRRGDP